MPEHVDALLSDLGIDTEEASQVRVALLSAAPGHHWHAQRTQRRRNTPVSVWRNFVSAGATSRKVRAHCRGTGLWLSRNLVPPGAPGDSGAPLADFREGRTGLRRQALRNVRRH